MYKGLNATTLREVIALGIYFGGYEAVVREFDKRLGNGKQLDTPLRSFFAGGIAGCMSWIITYPIDYVKTVLQSDCL